MRIQQFVVELHNGVGVFKPGDEISGVVILRLAKSIRIRGLRLNIVGESFSRWEFGKKSTSSANSSYIYKSYEKYVDFKQTLIGKDEHDTKAKNILLHKGDHFFDFKYKLPCAEDGGIELPTSMEGAYGYVRYCVRAVVDRPMKRNQWTLKPFTVIKTVDLNQEPTAQEQKTASLVSKVRSKSCVCRTGAHNLSLDLDKSGYCPGEAIFINAKCENGTSRKILRTSVDLLQVINYLGSKKPLIGSVQNKTRRTMKVVQSVRGEGCGGHSIVHWNSVPLVVPPIPPSRLDACSIIEVEYLVRLTAYLKNGKKLFCESPVLIGTEPLTSSYSAYYAEGVNCVVDRSTSVSSHLNGDQQQTTPVDLEKKKKAEKEDSKANNKEHQKNTANAKPARIEDEFFPVYTNAECPPASYEECVYGGATLTNDEYTMGQTVFVPLYRVYHTLRHQSIAIQAYGRASIVVEDISPYRPIGVPVSVQVSEANLHVGTQDDDEEYLDDEPSDALAYRESNGENEDSEVTMSPVPNGDWIPERPLEPIMFEVHHGRDSQVPSAAESPQMIVYQTNGVHVSHDVKVFNSAGYTREQTTTVYSAQKQTREFPEGAVVAVETHTDYSDSENENDEVVTSEMAMSKHVHVEQQVFVQSEPEEPRPLFSTEQVIISYEKEPYSDEIEEGGDFEEIEAEDNDPKSDDVGAVEFTKESLDVKESINASVPSLDLDSNGLPIGAMVPLTNSNESFNSGNTTDDQPTSEVFQDDGSAPTEESKPTMETLEIITDSSSNDRYLNGDEQNYEPTLQIAPPQIYQRNIEDPARYSESDATTFGDFHGDAMSGQHDSLPNGTASNTFEELSVDTTAPTAGYDSTEAEYHSGSSNCAEFLVNSVTPDCVDPERHMAALTPELPSPSFPEPIEEVAPCAEEESAAEDDTRSDREEVTAVYQGEENVTDEARDCEDQRSIRSSGSSMVEPLNYTEEAESIANAAIMDAIKVSKQEESTKTSVHFNVEEEVSESHSIAPEKLLYADDVNTTESSDKTSYDNVPMDDLFDYDETARSSQGESTSSNAHEPVSQGPEEPPPLVHLDSVNNEFDAEIEADKVFLDDLAAVMTPESKQPFQEVIANKSAAGPEMKQQSGDEELAALPADQVYNVPPQGTVAESSSDEEEDEEGLSAIEEEPSVTTQDGEDETSPPPIPGRYTMPDFAPPPIPQRIPAPLDVENMNLENPYLVNYGFEDQVMPEPLSPITEKTFDDETADEASPSVFSDNTSKQFDVPTSDCGSYDVNESEEASQGHLINDVDQTFNETFPDMDEEPEEQPKRDEDRCRRDDHSNENLESLMLPEREPITPEDDIYISYGPDISGTLVSEHAENDDYDIDDLIGPGPGMDPPPIDRSQKPFNQSPSHHSTNEVAQHSNNEEQENGDSFDDEDGLNMVQGSYPDEDELRGNSQPETEESAGERGESSDDVEERDCFGGVDSCDRLEQFGSKEGEDQKSGEDRLVDVNVDNSTAV